jgi:hypothetical protein
MAAPRRKLTPAWVLQRLQKCQELLQWVKLAGLEVVARLGIWRSDSQRWEDWQLTSSR